MVNFFVYLSDFFTYISTNPLQSAAQLAVLVLCVLLIVLGSRKYPDQIRNDQSALYRIVGIYAFFGSSWIFLSDSLVYFIYPNPDFIAKISMVKGIAYVASTSLLLYLLFRGHLKKYQIYQKYLAESEERFRTLVEQAPEAIFVYSIDKNHFVDANSQAEKLFGFDRNELKKLNFPKIYANKLLNSNVSPKEIKQRLQKVLQGETYVGERYIRNSYGHDIPCEVHLIKLPSTKHQLVRVSYIDISARKKAEMHIKEVNELKNNFIRIVSHQLRTPLTVIRWSLDTILGGENGQLNHDLEKTVRIASKSNMDIISRLNDLLTVMDIEENHIGISTEKIQVETLIKSVIGVFEPNFKIKKIKLIVHYPKDIFPPVEIDPARIRDVVTKLIDNALTYTPEMGQVEITLSAQNNSFRFQITDTGIGIPETEQVHIFQYFHRASNAYTMKEDSSGVSLGISKYFIEAHHGKIGFTSQEGKGSTFWFTLPFLPESVLQ